MPIKNSVVDAYSEIISRAYSAQIQDQKRTRKTIFEAANAGAIEEIRTLYNKIVSGINTTREDVKEYERRIQEMADGIPGAKAPNTIAGYYFGNFTPDQITSPNNLSEVINPHYNENETRTNFSRLLSAARNNKELDAITLSIVEGNDLWDYLSDTDMVALHLDDEEPE